MTSDQEDQGSPYLARPPRSLERACADIAGCGNGTQQPCPDCPMGELCPAHANQQAVEGPAKLRA